MRLRTVQRIEAMLCIALFFILAAVFDGGCACVTH